MTEREPRQHLNIMEFVELQEKRAEQLNVPIASLIPAADSWKPSKRWADSSRHNKPTQGTASMIQLAEMDGNNMSHIPPPDLSSLLEKK